MRGLLNQLAQIGTVTLFAVKTIPERKGSSVAAAFGIAGVVIVMVGVLSIAQGFRKTMTVAGSPERAIILRSGADTEMMSALTGDDARVVQDAPGIARDAQGALASAELFVVIDLPKRTTGTDANVPLRGVQPSAFGVRDEVQIIQGRRFSPGRNEVIVGRGAAMEFAGLDLNGTVKVGPQSWTVVGIFAAKGGAAESEIWTDASVLQSAYQRGNSFQTVAVRLNSAATFPAFKDALTSDPRLNVKVERETEFYAEQSQMLYNLVTFLGGLIASLMAVAAAFGALNTMYTAVSARTREIATLRALGFGSFPVAFSVLAESLVLALVGGSAGAGLAYWAFDGFRAATMNWQTFSQIAFAFEVTPALVAAGVFLAAAIGVVGGVLPAVRAARLPIATGLRAL